MKTNDAVVLVTGANRGLGRSLVSEAIGRGARRVYAAARDVGQLSGLWPGAGDRVVPLSLDVTDPGSIAQAAARATDVTLLINNAGVLASYGVLTSTQEDLALDFAVNAFGPLSTARAFVPALERAGASGGAAIVNVLSIVSFTSMPALGGYSASKAAAYSLTQALRGELAKKGVAVHAAFPGPIDTDMVKAMDMPKTGPDQVARSLFDGVEQGLDDILPDPASREMFAVWKRDPRELERQLAG